MKLGSSEYNAKDVCKAFAKEYDFDWCLEVSSAADRYRMRFTDPISKYSRAIEIDSIMLRERDYGSDMLVRMLEDVQRELLYQRGKAAKVPEMGETMYYEHLDKYETKPYYDKPALKSDAFELIKKYQKNAIEAAEARKEKEAEREKAARERYSGIADFGAF